MANKKYDVIIIGGGPGGITCGALLAKWGVKTLLIEQNDYTGGKAVTPTNKDGFSYELGPKLQVPAQGPSFAVAFKELGMESELKPIPLNTAGLAYRGPSGKYNKGTLPASTGLSPEPFFKLWDLEPSKQDVALNFMVNMAMMPADQIAALDDLNSVEWLARFQDLPEQLLDYL
jgi:phytoene dehydrogenase-like protein